MPTVISSQRFTDPATVLRKLQERDFTVYYVDVKVGRKTYRVVVDGHHSLAAAKAARKAPKFVRYAPMATEYQAMKSSDPATAGQRFLDAYHFGDDYYDVKTGENVW